jgi:hypothetical protein
MDGKLMAGDWIKWTKGLARRKEVIGIASRLGIAPAHAAGLCMVFWEWCDDNISETNMRNDGYASVTLGTLQSCFLDAIVCVTGFAAAMIAEGWLVESDGILSIPNYDRHNSQTAKTRALTQIRMARSRAKKRYASSVTPVTQKAQPEKRREDKFLYCRTRITPYIPLDEKEKKPTEARRMLAVNALDGIDYPPGLDTAEVRAAIADWMNYKRRRRESYKDPAAQISLLLSEEWVTSSAAFVAAVKHSIARNYQGLFPPKDSHGGKNYEAGGAYDDRRPVKHGQATF